MTHEQRDALRAALQHLPAAQPAPPVETIRSAFESTMASIQVRPDVVTNETTLGGRAAIAVRVDASPTEGVILYLHGGGFVSGSPATALGLTAEVVARTGVPAVSIDYRLAPETPFPGGLNDCLAAYQELLDGGRRADRIVVVGDSAGGNLAIALALAAKDAGLPVPAGIVAFSPSADMTRTGESMLSKESRDPFFTRAGLMHTTAMYLGGSNPENPLASPALNADFSGMPPMLVQAGTDEVLLDDAVRIADRAREAEVDVILDIVSGVPHVFPSMVGALDEAEEALDRAALFIRQRVR